MQVYSTCSTKLIFFINIPFFYFLIDIPHALEVSIENSREIKEKLKRKAKREKQKEYREKNKEKLKESKRKYYILTKEKRQILEKEFYLKNREKIKERQKEYRLKNREILREKAREYAFLKKKEKDENYVRKLNFSFKDEKSTREYFEQISKQFHISELSDWYRISRNQILQNTSIISYSFF